MTAGCLRCNLLVRGLEWDMRRDVGVKFDDFL